MSKVILLIIGDIYTGENDFRCFGGCLLLYRILVYLIVILREINFENTCSWVNRERNEEGCEYVNITFFGRRALEDLRLFLFTFSRFLNVV